MRPFIEKITAANDQTQNQKGREGKAGTSQAA